MAVLVRLEPFEGPLDLLLHLIDKAQVDIRDIFVSQITEQYLAHIATLEAADLESASEFLAMAATLLEIKSRKLLPQEADKMAEDEDDPEQVLIRQLEEYKRCKQAAEAMRLLEERGLSHYTKLAEETLIPPVRFELDGLTLAGLTKAFEALLVRMDERERTPQTGSIQAEVVTVADRMAFLQRRLRQQHSFTFSSLFSQHSSRITVVCTFVAILELLRLGRIAISQEATFGEIQLISTNEKIRKGGR